MTLIQRDGYVTNDVQDELVTLALTNAEVHSPDHPVLYEWCADQVSPPFGPVGGTLGEASWQMDFTSCGGPLIVGTGAQLSDAGLMGSVRAYREVEGFRSVLSDIAAKAAESGCEVWPWSPEQIERLAIVFSAAQLNASYSPGDQFRETNGPQSAGIRAVLSEMATLHTWHPGREW